MSWRRLSMRKTCPIDLPDQNPPRDTTQYAIRRPTAQIARTLSSANRSSVSTNDFTTNVNFSSNLFVPNVDGNNENYCFNETMTPSTMTANALLLTSNGNNHSPTTSSGQPDQHVLSNEYDSPSQLPELSSLNNEFLNTILATPNYQQPNSNLNTNSNSNSNASIHSLQHETNFVHNIDEESDCVTAFEESRPRQFGRRSEMRSRIVSITAERSAEGNQVIPTNAHYEIKSSICN